MTAINIITTGSKIKIREKTLDDARNDYKWSRDIELSRLDAASPLNMTFSQYIDEYTLELRYPSLTRRRFAIETLSGEHIGNCSYYNIDLKRGESEIGIMIGDPNYWNKGYGTDTIQTLLKYVFKNTNFNRLYLKTLEWNIRAQQCFLKCGFTVHNHFSRNGYKFLLMEITRKEWQKQTAEQEKDAQNKTPAG
jgi:RimJ/RimL family protein N-acetyltransferase